MTDLQNHILVVDDEFLIAEGLAAQINDMGLEVCGTADTAAKAIMLAQQHRPIVILMDMRLRGQQDGVDAALAINATVGSKVIFITGSRETDTLKRIELAQPSAVLFKPISFRQLQTAVQTAINQSIAIV